MDCRPPAPLSMGILQARMLKWVAMPFSRGNLPNPGIEPRSPALQADSFPSHYFWGQFNSTHTTTQLNPEFKVPSASSPIPTSFPKSWLKTLLFESPFHAGVCVLHLAKQRAVHVASTFSYQVRGAGWEEPRSSLLERGGRREAGSTLSIASSQHRQTLVPASSAGVIPRLWQGPSYFCSNLGEWDATWHDENVEPKRGPSALLC